MKRRSICGFLLILLLISGLVRPVCGLDSESYGGAEKAKLLCEGILDDQLRRAGAETAQEWLDGSLREGAGSGSEWFVIALRQWMDLDFSRYPEALLSNLAESQSIHSPTSLQKYALTLYACGAEDPEITRAVRETVGAQGVMSWIYGIHLLNNGIVTEPYSLADACTELLALRTEDGGWAVMGDRGDVDVTAMAIQALAPSCSGSPEVREAVERAVSFLSQRQNPTGGFSSFGVESAESTAQVILALSSLGIDCTADERFSQYGVNPLEVLERYRLPDGSFSHTEGGESNQTATVQVFSALISYLRMAEQKTPFYVLDRTDPGPETGPESGPAAPDTEEETVAETVADTAAETETDVQSVAESEETGTPADSPDGTDFRIWISLAVFGTGAAVCLILYLRGKRNARNILVILLGSLGLAILILLTRIQLPEEYYASASAEKKDSIGTVTISIRCDTIEDRSEAYIPDDGILLKETDWTIREGDTVLDVLSEVTASSHIALDKTGSGDSAYIRGIGFIYEQSFGPLSGWMYEVNGISPMVGCGQYVCLDGDRIEWIYTCNLGEDLNDPR